MTKRLADVDLRETPTAAEIEATKVLLEQVTARLQVIFDDGMLVPSAPLLEGLDQVSAITDWPRFTRRQLLIAHTLIDDGIERYEGDDSPVVLAILSGVLHAVLHLIEDQQYPPRVH